MNKVLILLAFAVSLALGACKPNAEPPAPVTADGGENSQKSAAPATNSQGAADQSNVMTALVGTWQTTCQRNYSFDCFTYSTLLLDKNGNKIHNILMFNDSYCKDSLATLTDIEQVQFGPASTTLAGAQETIANNIQATITPASDAAASIWNSRFSQNPNISCKSSKFQKGVTTDMTSCIQALNGVTSYSLFKLNGSQLQVGDCSGKGVCKSAATRATTLDPDIIYTKVN